MLWVWFMQVTCKKNNVQLVHMHLMLTVSGIFKRFAKEGDV